MSEGAALRELRVARQMLRDADERSCRETDGLCSSPWCNGNHHDSACEGDYMTRRVLEGIDELLARQPQETPAPAAAPAPAPTAGVTEATIDAWRQEAADDVVDEAMRVSTLNNALTIMRTLLAERDAATDLVAAHRAELCIAYDVIDALPDGALDAVGDAKLLTLMRTMDDEQKRQQVRDRMGTLVEERDALKAEVERLRATQRSEEAT